jgi:hypothetical protein
MRCTIAKACPAATVGTPVVEKKGWSFERTWRQIQCDGRFCRGARRGMEGTTRFIRGARTPVTSRAN